jgi:hypothetical protein
MGKKLGTLEERLLRTLEQAKWKCMGYSGSASDPKEPPPYCRPGWVWHFGTRAQLADGVYDLRASFTFLAKERANRNSARASLSRAVNSLIRRGILERLSLAPLQDYDSDAAVLVVRQQDRSFLQVKGKVNRFVRRGQVK